MMSIEIEKPTTRGRWLHIIPATILVYIVAYMDRTNIAIGIAGGMDEDLGMTASFAGLVAGIFFIGYIFLQIPGGQIAERLSAKKLIAWTIVAWGGFALLTGFVQTPTQLLIIRFVLGVAEGAVYPAILALIGHWFPNEERARAIAYFQMNLAVASIITGPLSGCLLKPTAGGRCLSSKACSLWDCSLSGYLWFPITRIRQSGWIRKSAPGSNKNCWPIAR